MAISNNLRNVTFETDSKTMVVVLQTLDVLCYEFSDLVFEFKSLLSSNSDYGMSFIRKQLNRVLLEMSYLILTHIFYDIPHTLNPLIINLIKKICRLSKI